MEPNERGRSAFSGPGRELSPTGGVRAQSTRDGQIRTSTRYGTQCWHRCRAHMDPPDDLGGDVAAAAGAPTAPADADCTAAGGGGGGCTAPAAAVGGTAAAAAEGQTADTAGTAAHARTTALVDLADHRDTLHVQMDDGERGWAQIQSPDREVVACQQCFFHQRLLGLIPGSTEIDTDSILTTAAATSATVAASGQIQNGGFGGSESGRKYNGSYGLLDRCSTVAL